MKKTYHGSCHCGAVRYQAEIDLSEGTFKCNCSICAKARNWLVVVPAGRFRLLAGEAELTEYQFGARRIHHLFCRRCGVRPFGWSTAEASGKFYAVNVASLDDVDLAELIDAPVAFVDGRHDEFHSAPAETRHL